MSGPKKWTENLILSRIKEGRGRGVGDQYSPWLYVQEFSSRGTQTRIHGVKLRRTVHTFSYLERAMFLIAEFQPMFLDYQEQFAMDRRVTLGAAGALGVRHPNYPGTRVPVVMTLDAIVTTKDRHGQSLIAAWDAKPVARLVDARVVEKLAIHRTYCAEAGIPHYLFTDRSYSRTVVKNIDWIRMSLPRDGEEARVPGIFTWHPEQMLEQLRASKRSPVLQTFCAAYDATHRLERGTGLRIIKQLMWTHRVTADMNAKHIEQSLVHASTQPQHAALAA